ncbi:MAG: trehalose-phosphatase [Phycisphaerales bacterium]|nr:trehalose-phosphatase [Phycisphaerales bacterium]
MNGLRERLGALARSPVLLVATDFDGTLAPIVPNPATAEIDPAALSHLTALATLPSTHVAILSGRARADLKTRIADTRGILLVGSHGAEADALNVPSEGETQRLNELSVHLHEVAARFSGVLIERKPFGVVLHYRNATLADANGAAEAARAVGQRFDDVQIRDGACVVEFMSRPADKGAALRSMRHRVGASGVVFIGDDITDEDAFAAALGHDVAIKVGAGATVAPFRIPDLPAVVELLDELGQLRREWLESRALPSIASHSLLSDQRTVALVDESGRIVWMCVPRADSGAIFADLLAFSGGGSFSIQPQVKGGRPHQRYLGSSCVLESTWESIRVTDYLDCSGGRAFQRAGRTDLIRVVEGTSAARITFAPRLDFGRAATRLMPRGDGLEIEGAADPLVLRSPGVEWSIEQDGIHQTAVAVVKAADMPVVLELRSGIASMRAAPEPEAVRRNQTQAFWEGWASTLVLPRIQRDLVLRSAITLKALCYGPTGAILAAATTSLPEHLGGVRNWDYRYCWPRDAALAAAALLRLGNTGHAHKLLDWILGIVDDLASPEYLRPIYTVSGGDLGSEGELSELSGYGDSRPVRVSNAAASQVQLDVFGPIVDLVASLAERGAPISSDHWRLVRAMILAVERRWREPDHGIWEFRGPRAHHVYSRGMNWHAVDRALVVAQHVLEREIPEWVALKDAIAQDVLENGWNAQRGSFVGAYGATWLDAATLHIGLRGLISPDDPRFLGTLAAIERELRDGDTVYRYRHDDGLPGGEGGFHICMAWLIEAFIKTGRVTEAREMFDRLAALAGVTGLYSEQYDPQLRMSLGNHPQAYSHIAIINAAVALEEAQSRGAGLVM